MIDIQSATKGLTDKEIRDFVNGMTVKYFEATLRPNETAKEVEKVKPHNQKLVA